MKQLLVFTRTYYVDYSLLVAPNEGFCPEDIQQAFRNKVRGLINVDQYNPNLQEPRWLFSRINGYTLWGMGCWSKLLSPECSHDEAHRSDLRCFIGIIYHDEEISKLPYDTSYFASEFSRVINPIFMKQRADIQVLKGITPEDYNGKKIIEKKVYPGVNKIDNVCVLHDSENVEYLFGAALIGKGDLSIASNLLDIGLAFDERYKFMNASVIGMQGGQVHNFKQEEELIKKGMGIDYKERWEDERKKANRLMLIAIVEATGIIALLIAIMAKGIRQ